jgi:hypothetical protein
VLHFHRLDDDDRLTGRDGRTRGDGFFEIAVQPGAYAADVVAAIQAIPFDATFVEVHDDLDPSTQDLRHDGGAALIDLAAEAAQDRPTYASAAGITVEPVCTRLIQDHVLVTENVVPRPDPRRFL